MTEPLLTLKELGDKLWWWKHEVHGAEMERLKLHGYILAARNYELMRRSPGASEYTRNYLKLDRENKITASIAWANPDEFPSREIPDLQRQQETGWTRVRPHLQWNLRLSDRVLINAFLDYLNRQRNIQKIARNSSLEGKRNRPPTWAYVECLDMKRHGIGNMDDSQRGMASKAEDMAVQFFAEFRRAEAKKDEMARLLHVFEDYSEAPEFEDDNLSDAPIET